MTVSSGDNAGLEIPRSHRAVFSLGFEVHNWEVLQGPVAEQVTRVPLTSCFLVLLSPHCFWLMVEIPGGWETLAVFWSVQHHLLFCSAEGSQSHLLVDFFPNYLTHCSRALEIHFDMKSSKSCFLSEGAKDRKVKKVKCTFVCLERLVCFGIFEVYFSVVAKQFVQNKTNQKQNVKNFQGRLSVKGRQHNLEIKHNPVLITNGDLVLCNVERDSCYESEIKYSWHSFTSLWKLCKPMWKRAR